MEGGKKFSLSIGTAVFVIFCVSCSPKYTSVSPELHTQMMQDLKAGTAKLDCEFECAWSWIDSFRTLVAMYNSQQWEKLAALTIQIGHTKDISYFFLGRAAESLGYNDAAVKYYQQSLSLYRDSIRNHHCRDVGNCGGLDLAAILPKRIAEAKSSIAGSNGRFRFSFNKEKEPGQDDDSIDSYTFEATYAGSKVYEGENFLAEPKIKILENTPVSGCNTIVTALYSGGAHCCTDIVMGVSCGSKDSLYTVGMGHGGLEDPSEIFHDIGNGTKCLELTDQRFTYYNNDVGYFDIKGDNKHKLTFAESPFITRYVVWTPQEGWTGTKPGDLKELYQKLLKQELDGSRKGGDPATAISLTYYALMSGEDSARAYKLLESRLPRSWKSVAEKVFEHIRSCTKDDFCPIEAVSLSPK